MRHELGTFCYILKGLFGYACTYVREKKGVVEWAASNIDAFEQDVSTSHQVTALLGDVTRLLSEYRNSYVQASCTGGLAQPGFLTPVSSGHLRGELWFLPYQGSARLHPALQALIRESDMRHAADGLPTPGGSKAIRIQLEVAVEAAIARGGGGSGGGDGGGDGGGAHGCSLQRDNNADAGGGTRHGHKGTLLAKPV